MFRLSALTCTAVILLFSCSGDQSLQQCELEKQELIAQKHIQDSVLSSVTKVYGAIDSTSRVIAQKKSKINGLAKSGKLNQDQKIYILAEMDTINALLAANKARVSSLQGNTGTGGLEEAFTFMVQSMDEKNSSEDLKLNDMKRDLAQVSRDFSDLFEDYVYKEAENMEMKEQLSSTAAELEAAQRKLDMAKEKLQSGWYVIGTTDELKAKGLVYKKGFFEGDEVNEDFDLSQFKKVNIYDLKEIILDARKAELMTTHPSETYELQGIKKKVNKLVIKDPEQFWSVSKFLIIEIEK